jgi:hypothetical protein
MRILIALTLLLIPFSVQAETKTIISEATYTMGDGETPSFAEAMVLQKAKQMALEQAGTYLESYTKIHNFDLTAEEIQVLAGGVLQVEILDRARALVGDGVRFSTKIKALVTTDKMEELVRRIRGRNIAEEYKHLQQEYARLSQELEVLKKKVREKPSGLGREDAVNEIREHEKAFGSVRQYEAAFYQRLVTGEALSAKAAIQMAEKQLTQDRRQAALERLFKEVVVNGHTIEVGEPDVETRLSTPQFVGIRVPVTVRANQQIGQVLRDTRLELGDISYPTYRRIEGFLSNLAFTLEVVLRNGTSYSCRVQNSAYLRRIDMDDDFVTLLNTPKSFMATLQIPMDRVGEISAVRGRFAYGDGGSNSICSIQSS